MSMVSEKILDRTMLELTANMPMKQINLDSSYYDNVPGAGRVEFSYQKPYLQRYYAGTFRDDCDLWIHRFLSNDGDRHVHSHPFEFSSVIICGGYIEEYINNKNEKSMRHCARSESIISKLPIIVDYIKSDWRPLSFSFLAAAKNYRTYDAFDWHRIAEVQDYTWTAVIVKNRRLPKWYFKNDDGDLVDMRSSPRDWWKNYHYRPESGIADGDNSI